MTCVTRVLVALAAAAIVALLPTAADARTPRRGERIVEIPFPGERSARLSLECGALEIRAVKIDELPSDDEIERADDDDTERLRWLFTLDNEGRRSRRVTIGVRVLTEDGDVLAEDTRTDVVRFHSDRDRVSVWTEIRTREIPDAATVEIEVECGRD